MSYYDVVGAVFRLADNTRHAFQDPAPLLESFHLMAEDPDIRALEATYPKLLQLCATTGAAYTADQLSALGRWLRRYFPLPAPATGLEAFVRLGA